MKFLAVLELIMFWGIIILLCLGVGLLIREYFGLFWVFVYGTIIIILAY